MAKAEKFSSENPETRGNIAVATLTRGEGFVAGNIQHLPERGCEMNSGYFYATLAQLVEHLIRNEEVAGSIPAGGSIFSLQRIIDD